MTSQKRSERERDGPRLSSALLASSLEVRTYPFFGSRSKIVWFKTTMRRVKDEEMRTDLKEKMN